MKSILSTLTLTTILGLAVAAQAAPAKLTVTVEGVTEGQMVPAEQAVCLPSADGKSDKIGKNIRPTIEWSGVPEGTKSIAVFMMDPDVPADFTDAGQEGKVLAKNMKRQDFYHYAAVNIAPDATMLVGGEASHAPAGATELPNDMGKNGYVPSLGAYGGPCPPWNDLRIHHYHYIVLALDGEAPVTLAPKKQEQQKESFRVKPTAKPKVEEAPIDPEAATAKHTFERLMKSNHVLAVGTVVGTYSLNSRRNN